jgi:AraC-like DNA-binding protein
VQAVLATAIPPLAWVALQTALVRPFAPRRDAVQLAVPAFTAFAIAFAPQTLDVVIPGVFLAYGAAMILALRQSEGDLPFARLEAGGQPVLIWLVLAVGLILSALSDGLIALALAVGRGGLPPLILSLFSSVILLAIGLLTLSPDGSGDPGPEEPEPPQSTEEDAALVARLDTLLASERTYLQTDLTLARLARRLHVPIKRLSAAINRATGQNVSRHINGYRIRHACALLEGGAPVTQAMLDSGFNTKSNFNREFARVMGQSPSDWLAARGTDQAANSSRA